MPRALDPVIPVDPEMCVVADASDPASLRAARDAVGWREWWALEGVDAREATGRAEQVVRLGRHVRLRPHGMVRIRDAVRAEGPGRVFPVWDGMLRRSVPGAVVRLRDEDPGMAPGAESWMAEGAQWPTREDAVELVGDRLPSDGAGAFGLGRMEGRAARADAGLARERTPYLHLLLEGYTTERDPRLLWTWLGMVSGLIAPEGRGGEEMRDRLAPLLEATREDWERIPTVAHSLDAWELDVLRERLAGARKNRRWRLPWDPAYRPPLPRGGVSGKVIDLAKRGASRILSAGR